MRSLSCGKCSIEQRSTELDKLLGVSSPGRGTVSPLCSHFSPVKIIYHSLGRYNEKMDNFVKYFEKNRKHIWQIEVCFMNLLTWFRFRGNRSLSAHSAIRKVYKANQEGRETALRITGGLWLVCYLAANCSYLEFEWGIMGPLRADSCLDVI